MMKINIKKQGMAIPLVLIFATIMGIVSTFLIKNAQNYNKQNQTSFAQLQSYFIARAGVEHAMIKIKYLHRELYDAICLSQGRNPLFDFSLITNMSSPGDAIKSYNPGPIFLYKSGEYTPVGGTVFTDMSQKTGYDKWIKAFESDLTSNPSDNPNSEGSTTTNTTLDLMNMPEDIKNLLKSEPYKAATYKLYDLGIAASEVLESEGKVDNNVIVEFKIKSEILTARDQNFNYEIKKTIRISRD